MKTVQYELPEYWASYLINRDSTGYTESELSSMHLWECQHANLGDALSCSDAPFFKHGCNRLVFTFPTL